MTADQVSAPLSASERGVAADRPSYPECEALERDLRAMRRKLLASKRPVSCFQVWADLVSRLLIILAGYILMLAGGSTIAALGAAVTATGVVGLLASWFHDAVHNNSQGLPVWVARGVARLAAAPLAFSYEWWKIKHVKLHHVFPGDPRFDPDINFVRFLRVTDSQPYFPQHRFQHLYFWMLLPFVGIMAAKPKEVLDAHRYYTKHASSGRYRDLTRLALWKYLPFAAFWIPVVGLDDSWHRRLLSIGVFAATAGVLISCVTQVQHNTTATVRFDAAANNQISLQLFASSDVASRRRIWWWLSGGTCFHAIHHVVPSLSFLELRAADLHLRSLLSSYGLLVPGHVSFWRAAASHVELLRTMAAPATRPDQARMFDITANG